MKAVKLQLAVLPTTRTALNDIAHRERTPLNRLIATAHPEVMALLLEDLNQRPTE